MFELGEAVMLRLAPAAGAKKTRRCANNRRDRRAFSVSSMSFLPLPPAGVPANSAFAGALDKAQ
jgi:hypothetical protein